MVMDTAEPSGFCVWTHTEISWTELDTLKLADGESVPLLETLCGTGLSVWFLDTLLTHSTELFLRKVSRPLFQLQNTTPPSLSLTL